MQLSVAVAGQLTPKNADLTATLAPMRAARRPPVRAPEAIEFHESSFPLTWMSVQSIAENMPPHTAKLPASAGERSLTALSDSRSFCPCKSSVSERVRECVSMRECVSA